MTLEEKKERFKKGLKKYIISTGMLTSRGGFE
jgi:hypothetical protein